MILYRDALMVVSDIKQCLDDVEEEVVTVPVELVDPSVARVYAKSKRGKVSECSSREFYQCCTKYNCTHVRAVLCPAF